MSSKSHIEPVTTHPKAASGNQIRKNLEQVKRRIAAACVRSGRDPSEVTLLPISKTVEPHRIRLAYEIGCHHFGENKIQELRRKAELMKDLDIYWHVVGHLQSNKVKIVAQLADGFQALDSLKIAKLLDQRLQSEGRCLDVLIQVNSSGEASKFGLQPDEVSAFVRQLAPFSALRIKGLMTFAIFSSDQESVRRCFKKMTELRKKLSQISPDNFSFDELSMGMSSDYELAVEEGATIVRVGQAIFGSRSIPDSYYWPEHPCPA